MTGKTAWPGSKLYMPQFVLGLISAVEFSRDLNFYIALKELVPSCQIFLSGEPVLENCEDWLRQNPMIDGILLRFVSKGPGAIYPGREGN